MDPRDGGEGWSDNRRNLLELGKCLGGGLTPEETCEVLELLLVAPLAGTRLPHDCLPYWRPRAQGRCAGSPDDATNVDASQNKAMQKQSKAELRKSKQNMSRHKHINHPQTFDPPTRKRTPVPDVPAASRQCCSRGVADAAPAPLTSAARQWPARTRARGPLRCAPAQCARASAHARASERASANPSANVTRANASVSARSNRCPRTRI